MAPPSSVSQRMKSRNPKYHGVLAGSSQSDEGKDTVKANDTKAVCRHHAETTANSRDS